MRESASQSLAGTASEHSPDDPHGNGHDPSHSPGERFAKGKQLLFGAELLGRGERGAHRELSEPGFEALDPIHQFELVLEGEHPLACIEFGLRPCPCRALRVGHGARISLILLTAPLYRPERSTIGCPR
jgi:hypothetical protein